MVRTPPPVVSERWQELLDDAEVTAAEYSEDGWETLVIHPGDVTPVTGTPFGLDVLAPGEEFETLESLVDDVTFETSHVYRNEEGGARFFVIVVEGSAKDDTDVAVVVPAFLDFERAEDLADAAEAEGMMYTHVRPLSDDRRVTFTHDDPELFF